WEDAPRSPPASAAPVLAVDGFEGPLDWLLELARAERIDLRKLSILGLVDAFVTALAASARADLSRWGEWLAIAAQLALLRSRLLLPPDAADAKTARAEAEALRRRLLEGDAMRRAAAWLDARTQLGREVFGRGVMADERERSALTADIVDLLRACLVLLRVPEHAASYRPKLPKLWRVQDALARITRLLAERPDGGALADFLPAVAAVAPKRELRCRAAVASTLVAGLELARNGALAVVQKEPGDTVRFCRAAAHNQATAASSGEQRHGEAALRSLH
ncbi:MAG: segregation/condensation protein A, partial [Acetobacteraceae bacterium]|nr:segregation/condensation protein A [Acetobacteraceae bacterium]